MKRIVLAVTLMVMLLSSSAITAQTSTEKGRPDSFETLFSPFFANAINQDGSIRRDLSQSNNPLATGFASGLSLVTLVKLFDLYNDTRFLDSASSVSDFLSTALNDPRYPLIATYYDRDDGIVSNYRNVVDNFLIAWGLSELADRIDPEQELAVKTQQERSEFVANDLDLFAKDTGFVEKIRVDREVGASSTYSVFTNLMAAFIITESNSAMFDDFTNKPQEVLEYVQANATTDDGGVHTLVFRGISDELITLRNTALYANLALNLYDQTDDAEYLSIANQSMQFIQQEFYDIGVAGGYFETLLDGSPVQQSKSLFSHALLLQLLLRLANLGDNDARLNLLALWRTISLYFRPGSDSAWFYSTLDRAGDPSSSVISAVDNVMMIYSMSELPLISSVNYTDKVEFRDQISLNMTLQVPENIQSDMIITVDDDEIERIPITGQSDLQHIELDLDPIRPDNEEEEFTYVLSLSSEGVVTDLITLEITVSLTPGIDLSLGVISIFSVMAVVIFVLFMRRYGDITAT